jgi:hypothetical protein
VVAPDAPPANVSDMPAAPMTGNAVIRRFRFEASFVCVTMNSSVHAEGNPRQMVDDARLAAFVRRA